MESLYQQIGRYQIEEKLGEGGIAIAYSASDSIFKRKVAVKILATNDPPLRKRFQKEVEILAGLEHPFIVPVYDFGEHEGIPFFVMRFMAGGSLQNLIKNGPLPLKKACLILERLASALSAAHAQGVVHRDIKPANILLDEAQNAYLSDFGTALVMKEDRGTVQGAYTGSPEYTAPEQVTWKYDLSIQTDVYQLGVVLFEMLTAELPFTGADVIAKHINQPVPRVTAVNPELPFACDELLVKAMAKEPSERFATPEEMVIELARIVSIECEAQAEKRPFSIKDSYDQGLLAFEKGDWKESVSKLFQVVEQDFGYKDAARKLVAAKECLTEQFTSEIQEQNVKITYLEAQYYFRNKQWRDAIEKFEEVTRIQAGFRDSEEKLEKAQTQLRLEELYREAVELTEKGEWKTAVAKFEQILVIQPEYEDVSSRLQQAKEEYALEKLYGEAQKALDYAMQHFYENWFNRAKRQFTKIQQRRPGYRDVPQKLIIIENQVELLELYQNAILYEADKNWNLAILTYGKVLQKSPEYRDAASRLAAIKKRREEFYLKGKNAFSQRNWRDAIYFLEQCKGYKDADEISLQAYEQQKLIDLKDSVNDSPKEKISQEAEMSEDLTYLYEKIVEKFNIDELKTLCFSIDIDYERLGGEGKGGKVRELVEFCERHEQLLDLKTKVKEFRPGINWEKLGEAKEAGSYHPNHDLDVELIQSSGNGKSGNESVKSGPSPNLQEPDEDSAQTLIHTPLIKRLIRISYLTSLLGAALAGFIILLFGQSVGCLYQSLELGAEGIIAVLTVVGGTVVILTTQHSDDLQKRYAYFGLGFFAVVLVWLSTSVAPKDNGNFRYPQCPIAPPEETEQTTVQCLQNTKLELLVESGEGRRTYQENETISLMPGDSRLTMLFAPDCSKHKPPIIYQWIVSQGTLLDIENTQATYITPPDAQKDVLTIIVQVPEENNHTETFGFPIEIIEP